MSKSDCRRIAEKFTYAFETAMDYRNKYLKMPFHLTFKKKISERQFIILCILAHSGENTVSRLAKMMGISKSTLSIIMGKMIKNNYILKTYPKDGDDKRKTYFHISREGKSILEKAEKAYVEDTKIIYNSLNASQREYLRIAFSKLAHIVEKDSELISVLKRTSDENDELGKMIYEQNIFFFALIEQMSHMTKDGFKNGRNDDNLTRNQCSLLICIEKHKLNTVSKLENHLNSSGSTISITVSKLVKNGYVVKEYPSGDDDGRLVYLKATQKGRDKINEIRNRITEMFCKYISGLSEEKRSSVDEGLDMLISAFDN